MYLVFVVFRSFSGSRTLNTGDKKKIKIWIKTKHKQKRKHKPLHESRWPRASAWNRVPVGKKITRTASHHNTFLIQAKVHLQNKGAFLVIFAWKQITNSTNMRIKRLISAWPPSSSSASTSLTPDSTSPEWRSRRAGSRLPWNVFLIVCWQKKQMQTSWVGGSTSVQWTNSETQSKSR